MGNSSRQDELQQQLWELVYELLSDEEAEALCQRVTSEPDVARAYARIKAESELVAAAAKIEVPQILLQRPDASPGRPELDPRASRVERAARVSRRSRMANTFVVVAALLLVGFVGFATVRMTTSTPGGVATVAQQPQRVRTIVTSPTVFHSAVSNPLAVRTVSASGVPISTQVRLRVYGAEDNLIWSEQEQTDRNGDWRIELPGSRLERMARVEVVPPGADPGEVVSSEFPVSDGGRLTHLSVDKPYFRPGETVYFRSLTLARFDHRAAEEVRVGFEIRDGSGEPLSGSRLEGVTQLGVGNGGFSLPSGLQGGKYTCVAFSPGDEFPEQRRDFFVHHFTLPLFKTRLQLDRDSYAPGDEVVADFSAARTDGAAASGSQLRIRASVDGRELDLQPEAPATTDESGAYRVRFSLPRVIRRGGDGMLSVTIAEGSAQETVTENIVINLGRVRVEFFPEGGDLVPDLPNRVYFHSVDAMGRPVHVEGAIVDPRGREVVRFRTAHTGRGRFAFTPRAEQRYGVRIDTPIGSGDPPQLPTLATDRALVMQTGEGVIAPGAAAPISLYTTRPLGPLVVSASCRGAVVGLSRVESNQFERLGDSGVYHFRSPMALAREAAGVIRITVYQYGTAANSPALPVAERLVFRRPTQTLQIDVENLASTYPPGASVELSFLTKDEDGRPQSAVLGVVAVDDALLNLAADKSPTVPAFYYLTTEVDDPEDLEDADFFLSEQEGAAEALDLLLGTQGWRRFEGINPSNLVETDAGMGGGRLAMSTPVAGPDPSRRWPRGAIPEPPLSLSRETDSGAPRDTLRRSSRTRRPSALGLGRIALAGGAGLLILLAVLAVAQLPPSRRTWMPAAALATVCLILGMYLHGPGLVKRASVASAPASRPDSEAEAMAAGAAQELTERRDEVAAESLDELQLGVAEAEALGRQPPSPEPSAVAGGVPPAEAPQSSGEVNDDLQPPMASEQETAAAAQDARGLTEAAEGQPGETWRSPPAKLFQLQRQLARSDPSSSRARKRAFRLNSRQNEFSAEPLAPTAPSRDRAGSTAAPGPGRMPARPSAGVSTFAVRRYAFRSSEPARLPGEDFETILWDPLLIADENGRSSVRFDLPAAGVYRLRVDAHHDGRLGFKEVKIRAAE